jgi:hypothetical protein
MASRPGSYCLLATSGSPATADKLGAEVDRRHGRAGDLSIRLSVTGSKLSVTGGVTIRNTQFFRFV